MINQSKLKLFFSLLLVLIIISTAKASDEKIEAIFQFSYKTYSTDFIVYMVNDEVFIPMDEALSYLRIYYLVDESKKYSGYMNQADSSYVIDFNNNYYIDIRQERKKLNTNKWFVLNHQVYIQTDVFADLFQFEIQSSFNRLSVHINSNYELPLHRILRVEYYSNNFNKDVKGDSLGPLIYDKEFHWINGGVLEYSLNGNYINQNTRSTFNTGVGITLLGGEYHSSVSGTMLNLNDTITNLRYNNRWRYNFDSKFIRSLSIFDLPILSSRIAVSRGYRKPTSFIQGIQITNEEIFNGGKFSNYIIEDIINPNWSVELYINNKLYDIKRTDLSGYYRFEFPINWGSLTTTIKQYGPNGEFYSETKDISISSALLKPGDLRYVISAGQDKISQGKLIDGSLSLGLFDWLTTSVSFNKFEATKDYTLVSQSSFNLFSQYLLNITLNNVGIYDATIKIPKFLSGNFDVTYVYYNKNIAFNKFLPNYTIYFIGSFNRLFNQNIGLNFNASREDYGKSSMNFLNSNISMYFNKINFNLRHIMSVNVDQAKKVNIIHYLNNQVGYYIDKTPNWLFLFNRTRISLIADINPKTWDLININAVIDKQLTTDMYFSANCLYNFGSKYYYTSLGINMNLPFARSQIRSSYNKQGNASYYMDLSGSIEYDSYNNSFNMLNLQGSNSNIGRSSANIKFYVDNNGDKIADDEELLREADFLVTNMSVSKIKKNGYWSLSNLIPGKKYNIRVLTETFNNPNIIPSYEEFSFVADPYTYKTIDILCAQGGLIEGAVTTFKDNKIVAQNGVKIIIVSKDATFKKEVLVFSDGTYYLSGLPVGNYYVYIDSLQLNILNSVTNPNLHEIEIKPLPDGDFIGKIDFVLSKTELKPSDSAPEERLATSKAPEEEYKLSASKEKKKYSIYDDDSPKDSSVAIEPPSEVNVGESFAQDSVFVAPKEVELFDESENIIADNILPEDKFISEQLAKQKAELLSYNKKLKKEFVISFASHNETSLSLNAEIELGKVAALALGKPGTLVVIEAHSDNISSNNESFTISSVRANEVAIYLLKKGLQNSQILIHPKGASDLLDKKLGEDSQKKNRRVVLKVIE